MFEGRFFELAIIFVATLVVLGPERMPGLVRTVGRWIGKARVMARDFQQQLENEVQLDELKRMTEAQTPQAPAATPVPSPEIAVPTAEAAAGPAAAPVTGTEAEAPQQVTETLPADSGYPYGAPAAEPGAAATHAEKTEQKDHAAV